MSSIENNQTYYHHTDHLSGSSVESDKNGVVVEVLDYYPYGSIRTDNKYTAYENDKKFTGYELDDTGLYYAGQRYYDSEIGRFVSVDPLSLVMGTREAEEIAGMKILQLLADPQNLNSYSYVRNNPLRYADPDGQFIGQFGRDMAAGQRKIGNFFNASADYIQGQGGIIGHSAAFVNHTIGDVFNNTANVFDPDQNVDTRVMSLGLVALDTGTGGKSKVITHGIKDLPRVFRAEQKLNNLSKLFGQSTNEILDAATSKGVKYIDNANNGNINILTPKPNQSNDFIRITLDPTQEKIISAGHVRKESLNKYLNNGRFTPIDTTK